MPLTPFRKHMDKANKLLGDEGDRQVSNAYQGLAKIDEVSSWTRKKHKDMF